MRPTCRAHSATRSRGHRMVAGWREHCVCEPVEADERAARLHQQPSIRRAKHDPPIAVATTSASICAARVGPAAAASVLVQRDQLLCVQVGCRTPRHVQVGRLSPLDRACAVGAIDQVKSSQVKSTVLRGWRHRSSQVKSSRPCLRGWRHRSPSWAGAPLRWRQPALVATAAAGTASPCRRHTRTGCRPR
jgi:hypothetical protein